MVEHQDEDILQGLMVEKMQAVEEMTLVHQVVEMEDIKTYTKLEQLHKHQEEQRIKLYMTLEPSHKHLTMTQHYPHN